MMDIMGNRHADGSGCEPDVIGEVVCGGSVSSATTAATGERSRKGVQRNDRRGSIFDGFGDTFDINGGIAMATGTEA